MALRTNKTNKNEKKIVRFIATVCIAFACGLVWKTSTCNNQSALIDSMVEVLADDEGGQPDLNKAQWVRYYRPTEDGYNCTKGGNQTC